MSTTSDDSVEDRLIQVSEHLKLPRDTLQITRVRLNQLSSDPDVDEDSLDNVAAAALALSAREDGLPVGEDDIAQAWSETVGQDSSDVSISQQQLEAVGSYLDIDDVPPHPDALVKSLGQAVEMPDELVRVAHQLLHDAFDVDPTVVAGGPSPAATAGAVLSIAASINDKEDTYGQDAIGKASGGNQVTVRNRARELKDLLGDDRLQDDRYQVSLESESETSESESETSESESETSESESTTAEADSATTDSDTSDTESTASASASATSDASDSSDASDQSMAADGAGAADTGTSSAGAEQSLDTVEAVEEEIDAMVDELGIGASTRLLARGMVGDTVDGVDPEDASKLAGATVVAASRMEDGENDTIEVASLREFEPRAISQWLDTLEDRVDVDVPRRDADEIIDELIDELGFSPSVREESLLSLERYTADEGDVDYTAAELGAAAVMFAAVVSPTEVDVENLSAISGANPDYITDAMNSIVVSLCLGLVQGDLDYDDCSWTDALLNSHLSPDIGDAQTGRAIATAKTYTAGREHQNLDDATLDVLL